MARTVIGKYWYKVKVAACVVAACLALAFGLRQLGLSLNGFLPRAWLEGQGFVSSAVIGYLLVGEALFLLLAALLFWYTGKEVEGEAISG